MILVLAEKPALGKAIADALPGRGETADGVITKGDYTIVSAVGHLLTLKDPEDYDEKYKEWKLEDLPIYFPNWGQKVGKETSKRPGTISKEKRLKQMGQYLKKADKVIHAGDNDEEGQLLIDEILRWFHYDGPVYRLDTANTSREAMSKALRNLKDNKPYEADGWSAFARGVADKTFGYNLSRYYSIVNHSRLTLGRVQTPTLGLVVMRDLAIEGHKKSFFYDLFASIEMDGKPFVVKYEPDPKNPALTDGKFLDKDFLQAKEKALKDLSFSNAVVSKETQKESPPLPFNLNKLNIYCSKKWGLNPSQVMKITQSLRDNHKAITYNRSDCQYLGETHYKEAPQTIDKAATNIGLPVTLFDPSIKSRCFNDANITAHFAIIPTAEKLDMTKLTDAEKNVYKAICLYYLAQFMTPAEKIKTVLTIDLGHGERLRASATRYVKEGYRSLLSDSNEEDVSKEEISSDSAPGNFLLNAIAEGTYSGKVKKTGIKEKETKPPSRYTQATLCNDMTRISKYVDDPEIKKLLLEKDKGKKDENGSIGTSATRAIIVQKLIETGYLSEKKEGKTAVLISTPKGREFYNMLPNSIKKADITAKWWVIQEDIKLGKATTETLAQNVLETVKEILHSGAGKLENAAMYAGGSTGTTIGNCPVCGSPVMEREKFYSCSNKDCKFVIFKENRLLTAVGKKMTPAMAKSLVLSGKMPLKGCKSPKTGKLFDCTLKLDLEKQPPALEFVFNDTPNIGKCPKCGGEILQNSKGNYYCAHWKDPGCDFRLYGTIAGKKLTATQVRTLLSKGKTGKISGFASKSGSQFDAALVLDNTGKVSFEFASPAPKKE